MIAYNLPITKEWKDSLLYCGEDVITHQVIVQQGRGKQKPLKDVTELVGKDIYVKPGKYYDRLVNLNSELGGGIRIHEVTNDSITIEDLITQVAQGKIPYTVAGNKMKLLEDKILAEGIAESENILKVDSFINHQVDPELMKKMGKDIAEHYKGKGITRIATIESSGIAPALMAAEALGVPLVILKKQPSKILNHDLYQTVVTSYTKGTSYELTISAKYISENDHILIVDDFLANGEAATGAIRLIRKAHATIAGVSVLIEKAFQPGREKLEEQGIDVYSLARVSRLDKGVIEFVKED